MGRIDFIYLADPKKDHRDFKHKNTHFWCLNKCAGVTDDNKWNVDPEYAWKGEEIACRNSKRDCAHNQVCNFEYRYIKSNVWPFETYIDIYDESFNWGKGGFFRGDNGCIDCPGTTAESCQEARYKNRRTFEDCIDICAEGENPSNVQMNLPTIG